MAFHIFDDWPHDPRLRRRRPLTRYNYGANNKHIGGHAVITSHAAMIDGAGYIMLTIVIVPAAQVRLEKIAEETDRSVANIASSMIEQAALDYFRHRKDDPTRSYTP